PAEKQEDHYDYENQSNSSGRIVAPIPAVRPTRQRAKKRQNQNYYQNCSKHSSLLNYFQAKDRLIMSAVPFETAPVAALHRHANCYSDAGMHAVEQVVSAVHVIHIDIIGVIPVVRPFAWPWIYHAEPIASVLEAWESSHNHEREAANSEAVIYTEVSVVALLWNLVAVVSATLLPVSVIRLPVPGAMLLPHALPFLRVLLSLFIAPLFLSPARMPALVLLLCVLLRLSLRLPLLLLCVLLRLSLRLPLLLLSVLLRSSLRLPLLLLCVLLRLSLRLPLLLLSVLLRLSLRLPLLLLCVLLRLSLRMPLLLLCVLVRLSLRLPLPLLCVLLPLSLFLTVMFLNGIARTGCPENHSK